MAPVRRYPDAIMAPPWRHFDAVVCHHPGTTLAPPWPHVRGFYIYTSFTSFLHQFYDFTSLWHSFILVLWTRLYNYRNNGYNRCIDAHKYLNIWRNNRQCLYFETKSSAAFYIWCSGTFDLKYLLSLYTLSFFYKKLKKILGYKFLKFSWFLAYKLLNFSQIFMIFLDFYQICEIFMISSLQVS